MISLHSLGDFVIKFDEESGQTWILKDDDDDCPVWIEILEQVVETEEAEK